MTAASDRRIKMTQWLGIAYERLCSRHSEKLIRRAFERTGLRMDITGEGDQLITPRASPTSHSLVRPRFRCLLPLWSLAEVLPPTLALLLPLLQLSSLLKK
jgi:hypothetical protein